MSKKFSIKTNNYRIKTLEEIKSALHTAALTYSDICNKKLLFIYRRNSKDSPYYYYEAECRKENFIHLVGCKSSSKISAADFYDECLNSTAIKNDHIIFKKDRKSASIKLDIFPLLFSLKHVKLYKMGEHDLLNEKNDFEMALSNMHGTIGFSRKNAWSVPTTLLTKQIHEYASSFENVIAVLTCDQTSRRYDSVFGCISSGILISDLPVSLQNKINLGRDIQKIQMPL